MTVHEIETPALIVDLDLMEANLARMAGFFSEGATKLRPHFKNHKCPQLAAKQIAAGAIGMTCATLREAECLVHHGVQSVLLANEIVDTARMRRFVELSRQADAIVCIDNEKIAAELARVARDSHAQVSVLVDVDTGLHRCGVPPGEPAIRLAQAAAALGLRFRGLMGYEGHVLRMAPGPEKTQAVAAAMAPLVQTKEALERTGMTVEIVSAGGTGSYSLSGRYPGVTEIQAGSYLLMDADYRKCCTDFAPALTLLATVISKTAGHRVIIDAGLKALSCERGIPAVKDVPGLSTRRLTAEHGIIDIQDPAARVDVGDRIEMWVQYSDATVNLHERIYGVRGGVVEEIFCVEA
jgi:D-serine deaminase-like pyridoxal phosphate-dependent protein